MIIGVNKIINSPVVNKLKICDLKSSRSLKYTAIIIIAITARVTLYINQNILSRMQVLESIMLPYVILTEKFCTAVESSKFTKSFTEAWKYT